MRLKDFPNMPTPVLLPEELQFDVEMLDRRVREVYPYLNTEQRAIFDEILLAVENRMSKVFLIASEAKERFSSTVDNCLEIDTLKHRHFATTFNQQQFSKSGYEQVPLEPIDFDENRKLYNPLRLPKNKILSFWQQYNDILILVFFTVLSFWMRFYLISYSSLVVWDEFRGRVTALDPANIKRPCVQIPIMSD
ncbi:22273_t:CDS:2 [Gigaspora rosea]|nr:22273_t:CDS:2 [Gigaspora rosea]